MSARKCVHTPSPPLPSQKTHTHPSSLPKKKTKNPTPLSLPSPLALTRKKRTPSATHHHHSFAQQNSRPSGGRSELPTIRWKTQLPNIRWCSEHPYTSLPNRNPDRCLAQPNSRGLARKNTTVFWPNPIPIFLAYRAAEHSLPHPNGCGPTESAQTSWATPSQAELAQIDPKTSLCSMLWCVWCVVCSALSSGPPPSAGPPSAGPPKISSFFHSPATMFILSSLSWGSSRGIFVPGPSIDHFLALGRRFKHLQNSTRSPTLSRGPTIRASVSLGLKWYFWTLQIGRGQSDGPYSVGPPCRLALLGRDPTSPHPTPDHSKAQPNCGQFVRPSEFPTIHWPTQLPTTPTDNRKHVRPTELPTNKFQTIRRSNRNPNHASQSRVVVDREAVVMQISRSWVDSHAKVVGHLKFVNSW